VTLHVLIVFGTRQCSIQGDVDGNNLSTSKYSYSPPKLSSPTTSNLAALLQHHHPAVAMVEKDSRLFQLSKSCVGICTCCFNGCCLACPVEMSKISYKWLGAPLLLTGCSSLVLEQGVSSLNLLTYQMTRFETLEVLEARRKITRELTCLYHAANVVSPPRLLPM
jgi:hypothetical protein